MPAVYMSPPFVPGGRRGGRWPIVIQVPYQHAQFIQTALQSVIDAHYQITNTEQLWDAIRSSTDFQNVTAIMDDLQTHFYAMLLARDVGIFIDYPLVSRGWVDSHRRLRCLPMMNVYTSFADAFFYMMTRGEQQATPVAEEPIPPPDVSTAPASQPASQPQASQPRTPPPTPARSQPQSMLSPARSAAKSTGAQMPRTPGSKGKATMSESPKWVPPTPERIIFAPQESSPRQLDPDVEGDLSWLDAFDGSGPTPSQPNSNQHFHSPAPVAGPSNS
ncbi:hypothetical protein VNI00_014227 [Paramarasmius palmivorus]|uniref:Uncharacterized protein n=1 Tax=Paramarasmius palmivorus TaxID=297713 RepID=A0AAW0BUK0_9AGAR